MALCATSGGHGFGHLVGGHGVDAGDQIGCMAARSEVFFRGKFGQLLKSCLDIS